MNKANVKYYIYDITGQLLFESIGMKEVSTKLNIGVASLQSSLHRNSLFKGRYYISKDSVFDKSKYNKKLKVNPLDKFDNKYIFNEYE